MQHVYLHVYERVIWSKNIYMYPWTKMGGWENTLAYFLQLYIFFVKNKQTKKHTLTNKTKQTKHLAKMNTNYAGP